jgi:hypothetical protein
MGVAFIGTALTLNLDIDVNVKAYNEKKRRGALREAQRYAE